MKRIALAILLLGSLSSCVGLVCQQLISQQLKALDIDIFKSVNGILGGVLNLETANLASSKILPFKDSFKTNIDKLFNTETSKTARLIEKTDKLAGGQVAQLASEFTNQRTRLEDANFFGSESLKSVLSDMKIPQFPTKKPAQQ